MIQLTAYGERVVDRFNMIGMWIAVVVAMRNFSVCLRQYRRTRGKMYIYPNVDHFNAYIDFSFSHIANMAQVAVFWIHRILYGIIPLFEIETCAYFPLLIS